MRHAFGNQHPAQHNSGIECTDSFGQGNHLHMPERHAERNGDEHRIDRRKKRHIERGRWHIGMGRVRAACEEERVRIPCFDTRPLEMWMGNVPKDGQAFPRFRKITDPAIIAELEKIKATMYS